jgi:hypothetical protein
MGQVMGPIYKMEETELNKLTKTVFFALWAFVQYRLGYFDTFTKDLNELIKSKRIK